MKKIDLSPELKKWKIFFILNTVQGFTALIWTASLQSDSEQTIFLGFSKSRLLLLFVLCLLIFFFFALSSSRRLSARLLDLFSDSKAQWILILSGAGGIISGILIPQILFSIYQTSGVYIYRALFERLLPVFSWLGLFSLEFLFLLQHTQHALKWDNIKSRVSIYRWGLYFFLFFLVVWLLIAITNYGLTPDLVGWGSSAVGLLEWQIWISWILCSGLIMLVGKNSVFSKVIKGFKHLDLAIVLGIYLFTLLVWVGQPIVPAYFATPGREPNFEVYPYSDGAFYGHFAQNILIGNGFKGMEIPPRPLYILFLAAMHALGGQNYIDVINFQTIFMAFFPLVLFFIGKELHNRSTGILLALLAIFKEWTAIITAPIALSTSNTKLFFADVPASLGVSIFVLLTMLWLKKHKKNLLFPLITGGTLGLVMLIRTQSLILLPAIFFVAFFIYLPDWKKWVLSCILVMLGVGLSIVPWLWRNQKITGEFVFDHPDSQTRVVAQRLSPTAKENPERLPGENDADYNERLSEIILNYYKTEPGRIISFVGAQLINCEINSLFILPVRNGVLSPSDLITPEIAFWQTKITAPNFFQKILILLNLAVVSIGLGASWKKNKIIGLIPIFSQLSYNFSTAAARYSGGRYLIPVDWIILLYYAIGLIEITFSILLLLNVDISTNQFKNILADKEKNKKEKTLKQMLFEGIVISGFFLIIGSSLPLAEIFIPEKYPLLSDTAMHEKFEQQLKETPLAENELQTIIKLMSNEDMFLGYGRAIYPRFYQANDGEPLSDKTGYRVLDYARFTFLLVSPTNSLVILKDEESPQVFPNASDVMVLGCPQGNYIDAALVILPEENAFYTAGNLADFTCTPLELQDQ